MCVRVQTHTRDDENNNIILLSANCFVPDFFLSLSLYMYPLYMYIVYVMLLYTLVYAARTYGSLII